jgi:hypothetical protein
MEALNDEKHTFWNDHSTGNFDLRFELIGIWANAITNTDGRREWRKSIPGYLDCA